MVALVNRLCPRQAPQSTCFAGRDPKCSDANVAAAGQVCNGRHKRPKMTQDSSFGPRFPAQSQWPVLAVCDMLVNDAKKSFSEQRGRCSRLAYSREPRHRHGCQSNKPVDPTPVRRGPPRMIMQSPPMSSSLAPFDSETGQSKKCGHRRQLRTRGRDAPCRGPYPGQALPLTMIHTRPAEEPSNAASRCPASEIPTPRVRHQHPLTQTPAALH